MGQGLCLSMLLNWSYASMKEQADPVTVLWGSVNTTPSGASWSIACLRLEPAVQVGFRTDIVRAPLCD